MFSSKDTPRATLPPLARAVLTAAAIAAIRPPLQAQLSDVQFDRFSTEHGLSQSTVNAILQDRQGFMWFGTQDGLNRFDSHDFTVFRKNLADTTSISDNYIWTLLEDRDGKIWIGTANDGLNRFDPATGAFTRYRHNGDDSGSIGGNNVTALCEDRDGFLWVGTWGSGLNRMDRATGRFTRFREVPGDDSSLVSDFVRTLLVDHAGTLWIGTWRGVATFDSRSGRFTRDIHNAGVTSGAGGNRIIALFEDAAKQLWISSLGSGIITLDSTRTSYRRYTEGGDPERSPASNSVMAICADSAGSLWLASAVSGVSRFDPGTGRFVHYRKDAANPRALGGDRVYSAYTDRNGGLWFGTADDGLSRLDPNKPKFLHLLDPGAARGGVPQDIVRSIWQDRHADLWIGTATTGLIWYSPRSGRIVRYRHDPGDPGSISSNSVMVVREDRAGVIWAGTDGGGMNRLDRLTGRFTAYRRAKEGHRTIDASSIMAMAEDDRGALLVGTTGSGLHRYDANSDSFRPYFPGGASPADSERSVWAIHTDRHGRLWLGSWGRGLRRYDFEAGGVRVRQYEPGDGSFLGNNTVWSIHEDTAGTLWFGTWGGGLHRYNPATDDFTRYTQADGLPNDVIYGILSDDRGNLWLSTNRGIARFDPASGACKTYTRLDGLWGNEFNQGAYLRGRDGILYFGGTNGLSAFHPDSLHSNTRVPPIVLTEFRIFDRPAPLERPVSMAEEIAVSHADDFIAFLFTALDYTAPGKNRYAYKLEGFDRDWIQSGTRRYAAYTGLSGGEYVFRVKGTNSDGVWNEAGTFVRLIVRPPFWATWWFVSLLAAAAGLALYALFRYRVRQLVAMERLRTRLASDLHDELASNLTSMVLFSDIVRNAASKSGSIEPDHMHLLDRIIDLAQESITSIRDIIWAIDPHPETLHDLLLRLKDRLAPYCRARDILLDFPDPHGAALPQSNLTPEQRKNLWLLLREAATNAIKHARCTELSVRYEYAGHGLTVVIRDNGCGFDPGLPSDGHGLRTMRMRAEQLGGMAEVRSSPGAGTTVRVAARL